jgi:hypothetical protein
MFVSRFNQWLLRPLRRWIAARECVLMSDAYRLGEYVGDRGRVFGSPNYAIEGMPVMKVAYPRLLKMEWMR